MGYVASRAARASRALVLRFSWASQAHMVTPPTKRLETMSARSYLDERGFRIICFQRKTFVYEGTRVPAYTRGNVMLRGRNINLSQLASWARLINRESFDRTKHGAEVRSRERDHRLKPAHLQSCLRVSQDQPSTSRCYRNDLMQAVAHKLTNRNQTQPFVAGEASWMCASRVKDNRRCPVAPYSRQRVTEGVR